MKKYHMFSSLLILVLSAGCAHANYPFGIRHSVGDEVRVEVGRDVIEKHKYQYEFGSFSVIRSEDRPERVVLVRTADIGRIVPFGRWSDIDGLHDGDFIGLSDILDKIKQNKVVFEISDAASEVNRTDPLNVSIPKTHRKMFDARFSANKCVTRIRAGWMPQRVAKKSAEYLLTCIIPGMEDSGYLMFVSRDEKVAHINRVEFYQYDRIPMRPQY